MNAKWMICVLTTLVSIALNDLGHGQLTAPVNRWRGEYYRWQDAWGIPTLSRTDAHIDFNWGSKAPAAGLPADRFMARWTGDWDFPTSGSYRFTVTVDDGVRLYVDDVLVLNVWKNQSAATYVVDHSITAGRHQVVVEYYDDHGQASIKVGWAPPSSPSSLPAARAPTTMATYQSISLYWSPEGRSASNAARVNYRELDSIEWLDAHDLWYAGSEYRGSIVGLRPGTAYEVALTLASGPSITAIVTTRDDRFPLKKTIPVSSRTTTLATTEGGSEVDGYVLYDGTGATIDVDKTAAYGIRVNHPYTIIRGFTVKGPTNHGIYVTESNVVVEDNDISRWGNLKATCGGHNGNFRQAGVRLSGGLRAVTIQGNTIHEPNHGSKTWQECGGEHPYGPTGIFFADPGAGEHVIRYNEITSTPDRLFYDGMKAEGDLNFTKTGFPGADSDIYQNIVSHAADDAIEADGGGRNVRIWGNYLDSNFVHLSTAAVTLGPLYAFRNVQDRNLRAVRGSAAPMGYTSLKTSEKGSGRIYLYHNTILRSDELGSNRFLFAGSGAARGIVSRNNVAMTYLYSYHDGGSGFDNCDFDHDLYNRDPRGVVPLGPQGIQAAAKWRSDHGPTSGAGGRYQLASGSAGQDQGVRIPNFNDGYEGSGPDMGAHEYGSAPMTFGRAAWRP